MGIPWRSSGEDSALSLPRTRVQSLVRELRSHKPRGRGKKERKRKGEREREGEEEGGREEGRKKLGCY